MKRFFPRVVLLAALALLAFGCTGKRLAIVNTEMVYQQSTASAKGTDHIKKVTAELEAELRALEEKAQSAKDKKAAQEELQTALAAIQQRFNAEQQQVVNALSDAYRKALENCRAKYNLDIIMTSEVSLSHAPEIDMTQKVTEEMNAIPLEFAPLAAETPAETPAGNAGAAQ